MAKGLTDARHYAAIAEVLRKNGADTEGTFRPGEMAQKLQDTCDFRYGEGHNEGYDKGLEVGFREGTEAGRQAEYDRFWDTYQQNGNRTLYDYAFNSLAWTDEIFKPKYDIVPVGNNANGMFRASGITNLKQLLLDAGVKLDTSNCIYLLQTFQTSEITHIPEIDARIATNTSYMVGSGCKVVTIDKLLVSETTPLFSTFNGSNYLENIVFEGTIGQNVDLHWSPLTAESIESTVAALSDTTSGMTASFKQSAVNAAFTTDEWNALVAAKPNWTITLA